MATLTRWRKIVPKWLGNAESPAPFAVEVKRQTWGERRDFLATLQNDAASEDEKIAMLASCIRGPLGDLVIDGERVASTEDLIRLALAEPGDDGNLFSELVGAVLEGSALGKAMAQPSAPASGGHGGNDHAAGNREGTAPTAAASSPG